MSEYKLVIMGNTPSMKNSKQLFTSRKTGKQFVTSSQTHKKWYPQALDTATSSPLVMKEWRYPLSISFHFIRDSHRHFDYINVAQACMDLLVDARIIEDDDADHIVPDKWSYQVGDKSSACCILTIRESDVLAT